MLRDRLRRQGMIVLEAMRKINQLVDDLEKHRLLARKTIILRLTHIAEQLSAADPYYDPPEVWEEDGQ